MKKQKNEKQNETNYLTLNKVRNKWTKTKEYDELKHGDEFLSEMRSYFTEEEMKVIPIDKVGMKYLEFAIEHIEFSIESIDFAIYAHILARRYKQVFWTFNEAIYEAIRESYSEKEIEITQKRFIFLFELYKNKLYEKGLYKNRLQKRRERIEQEQKRILLEDEREPFVERMNRHEINN